MLKIRQPKESEISHRIIDLFITASGFESRANFQAIKFASFAKERISLGFNSEMDDEIRKLNDNFYISNNFSLSIVDGEGSINTFLNEIIDKICFLAKTDRQVLIYIDYSCMTKNWYSYLLYGIFHLPKRKNIKLYLGYSHAEFVKYDGNQTLNRVVSPLFGYCDLSVPSKPTALIIGMGNEPNRIYGLKEYFDAAPYLFYSDSSYNDMYCEEVEVLNKDIMSEISPNNIFKFPIHDLTYTNYILENLCLTLLKNYRVILAPCGPKPFAILSMINSLKHDDSIEVWRISAGSKVPKIDRKPTGLISIIELTFDTVCSKKSQVLI